MKPDRCYTPVSEPALPNSEQYPTSAQYMSKRESVCERHDFTVLEIFSWQILYSWFTDWECALNSKQNAVCQFKCWHYSVLGINAEIQPCITQLLTIH